MRHSPKVSNDVKIGRDLEVDCFRHAVDFGRLFS
jgi:hypothetical protein